MKHFKQKAKRIFAAMLCLCMIASVLPMGASAADAVSEITVEFENNKARETVSSKNTITYTAGASFGTIKATGGEGALGDWIAISLDKTLEAGYYDVSLRYMKYTSGSKMDFYIVPYSTSVDVISAAVTDATPLETIVSYANSKYENCMNLFGVEITEEGKYMLVCKVEGEPWPQNKDQYYFYPEELKMKKVNGAGSASFDFTVEENTKGINSEDKTVMYGTSASPSVYNAAKNGNKAFIHFNFNNNNTGGKFHAFKLGAIASGDYKASLEHVKAGSGNTFEVYLIKSNTAATFGAFNTVHYGLLYGENINDTNDNGTIYCSVDKPVKLGDVNFFADPNQYQQKVDFEIKDLEAGEYWLVLAQDTASGYAYLQNFTMVPASEEEPQPEQNPDGLDVLGENYAILRRDASGSYIVDLFGGVKVLDGYSEVGFEVKVNDGEAEKFGDSKVYTGIDMQGDNDVNPDKFGEDASHVFYQTIDSLGSDDTITFRAYALKADGETYVYGYEYTVDVVAQ